MTAVRALIDRLVDSDEAVTVDKRLHWDGEVTAVAAEAARTGGPGIVFADTPGELGLASGTLAATNGFRSQSPSTWSRLCAALDLESSSYRALLSTIATAAEAEPDRAPIEATVSVEPDLYNLGLPTLEPGGRPTVTLGVIAGKVDSEVTWAPVRGDVQRYDHLRLSVPKAFATRCAPKAEVVVALGMPPGAYFAAIERWTLDRPDAAVLPRAAGLTDVSVGTHGSILVPAESESLLAGNITSQVTQPEGPAAAWEQLCETESIDVSISTITTRPEPIVPIAPLGTPLADDVAITGLIEAARLFRRVNNYWGVAPMQWIQLPAEAGLGFCIVSSEILYAGFDWQLANALFSFSDLFDKVLILDEAADPSDLPRAIDNMWVKAHPANDWVFSGPNAPAPTAPEYRTDGEPGSELYINATWDVSWDEEYIAPRVTYENSYPENIRERVEKRWRDLELEDL